VTVNIPMFFSETGAVLTTMLALLRLHSCAACNFVALLDQLSFI
jgi:hypothetical protein